MPLENANQPKEPTLNEADRADMEVFLQNILGMLPVLGVQAFEPGHGAAVAGTQPLLTCSGRGITATGVDTPQGFVVRSGSQAATEARPSLAEHFPSLIELRAHLQESGVLVEDGTALRFTQDFTFSSPSQASAVVLARPSNGRTDWKDAKGRTLKQLQEEQARP
jgi:hypothetical protein